MGSRSIFLATVSAIVSTGLGLAQNFSFDGDAPYAPNTFHSNGPVDIITGNVWFNDVAEKSGGPLYENISDIGLRHTAIVFADGSEVTAYDFCAELFEGPDSSLSYFKSDGFPGLSSRQNSALGALFSNALPLYASASGDDVLIHAAAIQLALWEIIEDGDALVFSLDELSDGGQLSVNLSGTDNDPITLGSVAHANAWLTEIESGGWTDLGTYTFFHAASTTDQNRLWVIPEPSVALLGLFGFSLALRRRRI